MSDTAASPLAGERIVHTLWWLDRRDNRLARDPGEWVDFPTYSWAAHRCWTIPNEPVVIVEIRP